MKPIYIVSTLMLLLLCFACDPIEDQSLREKYIDNVGEPISQAELQKAISVTQPFENKDGVVEGDQYVIIKNNRPDIGGTWHLRWGAGEKTLGTNNDTVIYDANGIYDIYYVGISANKIIKTDPITITVTNVFDEWAGLLTGAENKADKAAQKTWMFREVSWGSVCNMGAHGGWKYTEAGYTPESNFAWWASKTLAQAGNQTMTFKFDGNKLIVYNADGTQKNEGVFSFNHDKPEEGVLGEFSTTVPTIGGQYDEIGQKMGTNTFWILTLTDDYMTIYHPLKYSGGADWADHGWYAYFEAVK